ncbi:MAG: VWA domain-containing protein [Chloroflexi bacterium]|nr:VWA domain-containing protein [Chloroflexota bacterium]
MSSTTTRTHRTARSSNWRVNSSSLKAVEGAYILRSLRKVAGAVGLPAGYKVKFLTNGSSSSFDGDTEVVQIAAGDLFKKAPIPPENLDVLVGRTLHEVAHHTINTAGVWASCLHKVPMAERPLFKTFVSIGEDIVIDQKLTSNENLRDYYESAMEIALVNRRPPQMNSLLELWVEYALIKNTEIMMEIPYELVETMQESLQELVELTEKLRVPMDRFSGTRIRSELYLSSWSVVRELVMHPPELPGMAAGGLGTPESEEGEPENIEGPTQKGPNDQKKDELSTPMDSNSAPIDQRLADDIEEAMVADTEDITQDIYKQFENAGFKTTSRGFLITRKKEMRTIQIKPDAELCRRLERIINIRKRLQSRVMRGENYGKLDMAKLHRSQTDQRMFKLKYRFPEGFPESAILVDMSGSMSGDEAEEVIVAAASLANVVKCQIWSYAQCSSEIAITRLNDGVVTHGCRPEGNTPSGVALVAVAETLKKGGLIIHLTDGEHNVEFGPADATHILKKKGINAVHLLWGEHMEAYAGLNYKILSGGLGDFPDALYRMLIEQLKLDGLGKK